MRLGLLGLVLAILAVTASAQTNERAEELYSQDKYAEAALLFESSAKNAISAEAAITAKLP